MAPVFAIGSAIRQDRLFHARGISFRAETKQAENVEDLFKQVAEDLTQGEALVRLSPGVWTGDVGYLPDVLGMSVRFNTDPTDNFAARCGSQDLTLITAANMFGLGIAALGTNQRDFLDNTYYSGRYEVADMNDMRLRVVPLTAPGMPGGDRFARLRKAVSEGEVKFRLDLFSAKDKAMASPLVEITLVEEVNIDEEELLFLPFRSDQILRPQGLVQFMRPVPYLLSQYARTI